jgi:putative addiction module component (TIGR02574 family)
LLGRAKPESEKILHLQEQWDLVAENPDEVEVTAAQKSELDARLADAERQPDGAVPWTTVQAELRAKR